MTICRLCLFHSVTLSAVVLLIFVKCLVVVLVVWGFDQDLGEVVRVFLLIALLEISFVASFRKSGKHQTFCLVINSLHGGGNMLYKANQLDLLEETRKK